MKKKRGHCDYLVEKNGNFVVCGWFDNNVVIVVSNIHGVYLTHMVKRYDRKGKKHIEVPCPSLIKEYNSNMGGVDKCDMLMSLYRNTMKNRKL